MRFVLAFLVLILASSAAEAASFDCGKASSAFEYAICDNPEISEQDEILAKAWATALGGLDEDAVAEMRLGQRNWHDYAQRVCSDDAEPVTGSYTAEQAQCLAAEFRSRIRTLEGSRMQSGRRFYLVTYYRVAPDPDATPESPQKVATKQYSSVRIDGTNDEAAAFNQMLEDFGAGPDSSLEGFDPDSAVDASFDDSLTIDVEAITLRRIGLQVNSYWFGHGAAHGNYAITYLHFLIEEGRALEASDIFDGNGWNEALADLAFAELQRTIGAEEGALFVSSADDIRESVADPAHWDFSDTGLILQFQPYEVTAYAYGAPTVTISWDDLGGYLAEDAVAKAYY